MNGWFITLLVLYVIELSAHMVKHGEPRKDKYSFGTALLGFLIVLFLMTMAIKTGF